jgi:hypothetical protein
MKFEDQIEKIFYRHLVVITINIEIGSKIDPLHMSSKKLQFVILPTNLFDYKVMDFGF